MKNEPTENSTGGNFFAHANSYRISNENVGIFILQIIYDKSEKDHWSRSHETIVCDFRFGVFVCFFSFFSVSLYGGSSVITEKRKTNSFTTSYGKIQKLSPLLAISLAEMKRYLFEYYIKINT